MTRASVENSRQANELSTRAATAAQSGDKTVARLNDAMSGINQSAEQISKIIKVIEGIAFQTNLLALNAAVEAARAGEHGKGFAVVADEVRSLSQRAGQAARETTSLIEDAVRRAGEGADVAAEVGKVLNAISGDVTQVSATLDKLAGDSQGQCSGVEEIGAAIARIGEVIQAYDARSQDAEGAAERMAAASDRVSALVANLA